jgi:hypothetical protein
MEKKTTTKNEIADSAKNILKEKVVNTTNFRCYFDVFFSVG